MQNRTSVCLKINMVIASDKCLVRFQAVETRACNLSCVTGCVFSEWTAYSSCSCGTRNRTRSRLLLQFDTTRNSNCQVDRNGLQYETEPCNLPICLPTSSLTIYTWHTEPWSPCYVLPSKLSQHPSCGYGYQNRTIFCRGGNNQAVAEQFCINSALSSKPSSHQMCVVPCTNRCIVSDWSEFASCRNGNVSRTRKIIAFSGSTDPRRDCPELASILTTEAVPCSQVDNSQYGWFPYSFEDCIIESSSNEICGNGLEYRRSACLEINSRRPVSEEYCPPLSPNMRSCSSSCHIDCQLSEWSPWSDCSATCGQGYKTRTRTVRMPMQLHWRPCGPMQETTVCSSTPCEFAEYRPGPFGPCEMHNASAICGEGTLRRVPICVVNGVTQRDNTSCTHLEVSFRTQKSCNFLCPEECVIGPWDPWSMCMGTQRRTRPILREGTGCADAVLSQSRPCYQTANTYMWYVQPWKNCIISALGNTDYCGNGTQRRIVKCIDGATNQTVFEEHCEHLPKPSAIQTCNIPCPVDCKVSNFSHWTECPNTCDALTDQSRRRRILVNSSNGGQGCPTLVQTKLCLVRNCIKFAMEAYKSHCSPEYTNTSICGSVSIAKQVNCLKNKRSVTLGVCVAAAQNGVEVIGSENLNSVEEYCQRPCPTEPNCSFSDWSEWSPCSRTCYQSNRQSFSFRSRKLLKSLPSYRNKCLTQQYEEWLCEMTSNGSTSGIVASNTSCIEFSWQTSEWYQNQTRAVWCQSGIGTRVSQSGCIDAIRPVAQMGTC